jgi:hypothetical protein
MKVLALLAVKNSIPQWFKGLKSSIAVKTSALIFRIQQSFERNVSFATLDESGAYVCVCRL